MQVEMKRRDNKCGEYIGAPSDECEPIWAFCVVESKWKAIMMAAAAMRGMVTTENGKTLLP